MTSISFAVASMVVQSLADCVYKRAQVRGSIPESFLVFQSYGFGLTAFLFVVVQGAFRFDLAAWKYGPICGLLAFGAYYFFFRSLEGGQLSVNTMIFRLSFVLTTGLAVLVLNEPLGLYRMLGIATASLAVLCLTVFSALADKLPAHLTRKGFPAVLEAYVFPLFAFACLGTLSFVYKLSALERIPPSSLIFIQFTFFSSLAMCYAATRRRLRFHRTSVVYGLGAGVLLSIALILLVSALERGEAGRVVPINQMSFALTAILAVRWFAEAWTKLKTISALFAASAVVLLSIEVFP